MWRKPSVMNINRVTFEENRRTFCVYFSSPLSFHLIHDKAAGDL